MYSYIMQKYIVATVCLTPVSPHISTKPDTTEAQKTKLIAWKT